MGNYTDFLFARPSFLEGVSRVLDIGSTVNEYNSSHIPEDADRIALRKDTQAVANDLWAVLDRIDEQEWQRQTEH